MNRRRLGWCCCGVRRSTGWFRCFGRQSRRSRGDLWSSRWCLCQSRCCRRGRTARARSFRTRGFEHARPRSRCVVEIVGVPVPFAPNQPVHLGGFDPVTTAATITERLARVNRFLHRDSERPHPAALIATAPRRSEGVVDGGAGWRRGGRYGGWSVSIIVILSVRIGLGRCLRAVLPIRHWRLLRSFLARNGVHW